MNAIDHKASAKRLTKLITDVYPDGTLPAATVFALAQVHATLYVGDQQRTANLIQVASARVKNVAHVLDGGQIIDETGEIATLEDLIARAVEANVLVREALDLP